ncbi:MAG: hypothetical protein ABF629_15630 [Sporolactobacillus sp.]
MKVKKKVISLQKDTLIEVKLLALEFEQIINLGSKKKRDSIFMDYSKENLSELYIKRKNRKYAGLTVELYAIVEQFLKDLYSIFNDGKEYEKDSRNINTILDLEGKIKGYVKFDNHTKQLCDLRNVIVHHAFSFKQAKKRVIKDKVKSKKLFLSLLENVEKYLLSMNEH